MLVAIIENPNMVTAVEREEIVTTDDSNYNTMNKLHQCKTKALHNMAAFTGSNVMCTNETS
jgi:hypothetical protein